MKKGLAVLLVFGLLLMGVTPVLAAGEQVGADAPVQRANADLVLPIGDRVSDQELSETSGEVWQLVALAVVLLLTTRSCSASVDRNSDGNPEFQFNWEKEPVVPKWAR